MAFEDSDDRERVRDYIRACVQNSPRGSLTQNEIEQALDKCPPIMGARVHSEGMHILLQFVFSGHLVIRDERITFDHERRLCHVQMRPEKAPVVLTNLDAYNNQIGFCSCCGSRMQPIQ